jgi:hypothetical protein
MAISKKERSLSIWIGIAIGVAISSMLVRYALQKKAQQTMDRPGHYKSLKCGADGSPFHPIPETIRGKIPHGIVVHYEDNQTILIQGSKHFLRSWVIESSGSFRSERLFIHAQEYCQNKSFEGVNQYLFHRASELYLQPQTGALSSTLENEIDPEQYKIIGENSQTGEWIIQVKDISHQGLRDARSTLSDLKDHIAGVRSIPWVPIR